MRAISAFPYDKLWTNLQISCGAYYRNLKFRSRFILVSLNFLQLL